MSQTKTYFPFIYNPASQSPEEIVANFVIRLREFNEIFLSIKNDKMENPPQHFMIQGQRGYGKTTLLLRLKYEIQNDPVLSGWLLPVMFDEEQYRVNTLTKLWEEVIDVLEESDSSFAGLSDRIDPLYEKEFPEEEIFKLLTEELHKWNKKLVLLIDNFGDMIGKFSRKENQRLREVLITSNNIRIIGGSSAILEFYYNYKEPFFDFFKVIQLDELSGEETLQLLRKLAETYGATKEIEQIIAEQPERIEALRRLTGSVPRTVVLLFEIFIDDVEGNSFKDLEAVLDRVTPLYKHRLDNLSVQQQVIVDAIAQNWDAVGTKEIARITRFPGKAVSAQLNLLEKNQLIEKQPTSTKNHLYRMKERFFNIYYLMRLGKRKNRKRVLWLTRFFEIWCGETELADRAKKHISAMKEGNPYYSHAFCVTQALSETKLPFELQHELINEARNYLSKEHRELIGELNPSHLEVYEKAVDDFMNGDLASAKKRLIDDGRDTKEANRIVEELLPDLLEFMKKDSETIEDEKKFKFFMKSWLVCVIISISSPDKFIENLITYYITTSKDGNIDAIFGLSTVYQANKDYENAKKYYLMAIEKGDADSIFSLASMYQFILKDNEQAEKYYLMAVDKGNTRAMNKLGELYHFDNKDDEKARYYFQMAIDKGDIKAMTNLAGLNLILNVNKEEALKLQGYVFNSRNNKDGAITYIIILLWNNEIEEAIKIYQENCEKEEIQKEVNAEVNFILEMFLAKKQYHFVYQLFSENKFDIRDKYKPVYFALLSLMGPDYGDELKSMGSELKQTVEEIIKAVRKMEVAYA